MLLCSSSFACAYNDEKVRVVGFGFSKRRKHKKISFMSQHVRGNILLVLVHSIERCWVWVSVLQPNSRKNILLGSLRSK